LLIIVASKYNIQIHVCKRTERSGEWCDDGVVCAPEGIKKGEITKTPFKFSIFYNT
jgi:hypothetical protein